VNTWMLVDCYISGLAILLGYSVSLWRKHCLGFHLHSATQEAFISSAHSTCTCNMHNNGPQG
jgi:hypothetical protein